jgi:hypothetical protein
MYWYDVIREEIKSGLQQSRQFIAYMFEEATNQVKRSKATDFEQKTKTSDQMNSYPSTKEFIKHHKLGS